MSISGFRVITVFLFGLVFNTGYTNTSAVNEIAGLESMSDQIRAGIENVVHIVSPRFDASVESYLRVYFEKNRTKTENMIGRSAMYFPMFEEELLAGGLPVDLKYLAVVESALTPHAISRVGATGLWQFMRPTAREVGLQITKYIDERCDPVMSTKAAITYLRNLYNQFDSWELAMAAYNAGPGRVRFAIRKSGSQDYWKLQGYLPKETRSYVPGFIAASYVLNYYQDHGLVPAILSTDLTQTETVQVFNNLDFAQVQRITGVAFEVINHLNPKYIRNFIPQSDGGHTLVLPASAATTMRTYLNAGGDVAMMEHGEFAEIEAGVEMEYVDRLVEHIYVVKSGDNLYALAKKHHCTVSELQKWNKLSGSMLRIGQRLKILKMEKVLVKAVSPVMISPSPVRRKLNIPKLNPPDTEASSIAQVVRLGQENVIPTPVVKSSPDLSGSVRVLRRRLSAREMGASPDNTGVPLLPGRRLR